MSPVCLPFSEMMPETLDSFSEVAGWGAIDVLARRFADVLQYVVVPFFGKEKCDNVYKVTYRHYYTYILMSMGQFELSVAP